MLGELRVASLIVSCGSINRQGPFNMCNIVAQVWLRCEVQEGTWRPDEVQHAFLMAQLPTIQILFRLPHNAHGDSYVSLFLSSASVTLLQHRIHRGFLCYTPTFTCAEQEESSAPLLYLYAGEALAPTPSSPTPSLWSAATFLGLTGCNMLMPAVIAKTSQ